MYNNYQQPVNNLFYNMELPSFDDLSINIDAPPTVLPDMGSIQAQPVRPDYPGGPQVQPIRPDYPGGPQIQPPHPVYPEGPQIQPPRPVYPEGPQIQPPRPPFNNNWQANICINRLTFVWDSNNESYWTYPTMVRNNILYGYRWNVRAGWFPYEMPMREIRRYVCIR